MSCWVGLEVGLDRRGGLGRGFDLGGSNVAMASSSSIEAGSEGFSLKPSPSASGRDLPGADAIDEAIEVVAEPSVRPRAVRRLEQDVDRAVELDARLVEMAQFGFALAGGEVALRGGDERGDGVRLGLRARGRCGGGAVALGRAGRRRRPAAARVRRIQRERRSKQSPRHAAREPIA